MDNKELKEFVKEVLSHQIFETIGKEEEIEAWEEIKDYFGEEFERIILEIKIKYKEKDPSINDNEESQKERLRILDKRSLEKKNEDMWGD